MTQNKPARIGVLRAGKFFKLAYGIFFFANQFGRSVLYVRCCCILVIIIKSLTLPSG